MTILLPRFYIKALVVVTCCLLIVTDQVTRLWRSVFGLPRARPTMDETRYDLWLQRRP